MRSSDTRMTIATATMPILPLRTNEPSLPTASLLGVRKAHMSRAAVTDIIQNEVHASFFRRACLSAARAFVRMSGWPASTAPVKLPAMPGTRAQARQKTPVRR